MNAELRKIHRRDRLEKADQNDVLISTLTESRVPWEGTLSEDYLGWAELWRTILITLPNVRRLIWAFSWAGDPV